MAAEEIARRFEAVLDARYGRGEVVLPRAGPRASNVNSGMPHETTQGGSPASGDSP